MKLVTFCDGTRVWGGGIHDEWPQDRPADLGVFIDDDDPNGSRQWRKKLRRGFQFGRALRFIDWEDWGLPRNAQVAVATIEDAFRAAADGQEVRVACIGGSGRTGTVLACMAVLAGERPDRAVDWVRATYLPEAVETAEQEAFVVEFARVRSMKRGTDGSGPR